MKMSSADKARDAIDACVGQRELAERTLVEIQKWCVANGVPIVDDILAIILEQTMYTWQPPCEESSSNASYRLDSGNPSKAVTTSWMTAVDWIRCFEMEAGSTYLVDMKALIPPGCRTRMHVRAFSCSSVSRHWKTADSLHRGGKSIVIDYDRVLSLHIEVLNSRVYVHEGHNDMLIFGAGVNQFAKDITMWRLEFRVSQMHVLLELCKVLRVDSSNGAGFKQMLLVNDLAP